MFDTKTIELTVFYTVDKYVLLAVFKLLSQNVSIFQLGLLYEILNVLVFTL